MFIGSCWTGVGALIVSPNRTRVTMSTTQQHSLLWWVIPGVLADMPMPFIHPERRMAGAGELTAFEDELPPLYAAGVRVRSSHCSISRATPQFTSRQALRSTVCQSSTVARRQRSKQTSSFPLSTGSERLGDQSSSIVRLGLAAPVRCWPRIWLRKVKALRRRLSEFEPSRALLSRHQDRYISWSSMPREFTQTGSIKPAALNAGIAPQLAIEHRWPGVGEPGRSPRSDYE